MGKYNVTVHTKQGTMLSVETDIDVVDWLSKHYYEEPFCAPSYIVRFKNGECIAVPTAEVKRIVHTNNLG